MDPHSDGPLTGPPPLAPPDPLHAPAPMPVPEGDDSAVLAVVEVLDRDGRTRVALPVRRWPVTIGRAVASDIVLDDPFVAARHATLAESAGGLQLAVGETVNGVRVRAQHAAAGERLEIGAGDVVEIGGSRLRIRRAGDPLAPERRWIPEATGSRRSVLLLTLLFSAWNAGELWLNADPGGHATDYLPVLIGGPIAVAIWAALWSVGSKLIRHRFDFWSHARIALAATIGMAAAALLLPVFAFASGWTWPSRIGPLVVTGIGWSALGAHIERLLPGRPRMLAAVMASLFVAGAGLYGIHHYDTQDRVFPELYVATLGPPALRWAPTVSTARFIDEARALQAVLQAHAADEDTGAGAGDE